MNAFLRRLLLPFWADGLRAGQTPVPVATLQRKTLQINVCAMVAMLTVVVYNAMFQVFGNDCLILSGVVQLPFLLLYPLVLMLNGRNHHAAARWLLTLLAMANVALPLHVAQGTATCVHYYFAMIAVMAVMLFPVDAWRSTSLACGANLAVFVFYQVHGWPSHPVLPLPEGAALLTMQNIVVGSCVGTVLLAILISERSAADNERVWQAMASTDVLTGLPNRRAFMVALKRELAFTVRESRRMTLAVLDVDHFKRINDSLGHEAGDAALAHLASVLQQEVRESDMVVRMGGEEFAILMPAIDGERAMPVAERIRIAVAERAFRYEGVLHVLTISMGLAQARTDDNEASLIKAADEAMYQAKHEGRNCVRLADRSGHRPEGTVTPLVLRTAQASAPAVKGRVA